MAAAQPYDGTWNVAIQTKAGSCDPTANYTVTVTEGKVSGPANVSGTVGPSGNVRVSIGAAYASGQLEGSKGAIRHFVRKKDVLHGGYIHGGAVDEIEANEERTM